MAPRQTAFVIRLYGLFLVAKPAFDYCQGVAYRFRLEADLGALGYGGPWYSREQLMIQGLWELCIPVLFGVLLWKSADKLAAIIRR